MSAGAFKTDGLLDDDHVVLGVATCFQRSGANSGGKLSEVLIVEPLPASTVDCVHRLGVPTSYRRLHATTIGALSDEISELPGGLVEEGESVAWAESFEERIAAAARTFRRSPEIVEQIKIGETKEVNHSVATKRVLNEEWEPNFEDNVKQDISIDVYDRANDVDASEIANAYNA